MAAKREERVYIRLTKEEKHKLEKLAKRTGISISELIRTKVLHPKMQFINEEQGQVLKQLLNEAREIQRTLNLYHEKRQEQAPFFARLRKHIKKIKQP